MEENAKLEILEAINLLAEQMQDFRDEFGDFRNKTDARFVEVKSELGSMKSEIGGIKSDIGGLKSELGSVKLEIGGIRSELGNIKSEVGSIKSQMVTKSYLDDKLADLRSDLIALMRKSDVKLSVLIESLVKEGSLKKKTADLIMAMEPFASS